MKYPRSNRNGTAARAIGRLALALIVLVLGVAGCRGAQGPLGGGLPAGTCVVAKGNPLVDQESSIDVVSCSAYHTHVVVADTSSGPCPSDTLSLMRFCLRSALPSPSPNPGGITAP
jgi:hypothetical protein